MYKIVLFCTLVAFALSAPTEQPSEIDTTDSIPQEKSVEQNPKIIRLIKSPSTEKRDKREDHSAPSSSADNKRTPVPQPDYQENKPPTFVFPVPVDQIIKNSHVAPEIHSTKHLEEVNEEYSAEKDADDDKQHGGTYYKKTVHSKTSTETDDEESESDENH